MWILWNWWILQFCNFCEFRDFSEFSIFLNFLWKLAKWIHLKKYEFFLTWKNHRKLACIDIIVKLVTWTYFHLAAPLWWLCPFQNHTCPFTYLNRLFNLDGHFHNDQFPLKSKLTIGIPSRISPTSDFITRVEIVWKCEKHTL